MARFTKAHADEAAELKKKIARLEAQLRPLRERALVLSYGQTYKIAPETFIEQRRAPLEKLLPAFTKSTAALIDAGFRLDRKHYAHKDPQFEVPTVWNHSEFFGEQRFALPIGKSGAVIEVNIEVPMGNSKCKDEDYLAYSINATTEGMKTLNQTKLTTNQWDVLGECEAGGIEFKSFKSFKARLDKMIAAVNSLNISEAVK